MLNYNWTNWGGSLIAPGKASRFHSSCAARSSSCRDSTSERTCVPGAGSGFLRKSTEANGKQRFSC